jgi:hypothetical protein
MLTERATANLAGACAESCLCRELPGAAEPGPYLDPLVPRKPSVQAGLDQGVESSTPFRPPSGPVFKPFLAEGSRAATPFDLLKWAAIPVFKPDPDLVGRFPFRVERDACWPVAGAKASDARGSPPRKAEPKRATREARRLEQSQSAVGSSDWTIGVSPRASTESCGPSCRYVVAGASQRLPVHACDTRLR